MSCQDYRFQITAVVEGGLDSDEPQWREHLDSCPTCSTFQQEQMELDLLLGNPDFELEIPAGIWNAISKQIEAQPEKPDPTLAGRLRDWISAWDHPFAPAYGLAGLAALLLLSFSLFQLPTGPDTALLAQLDNYTIERSRPGNPFLASDFSSRSGNPFAASRRRP